MSFSSEGHQASFEEAPPDLVNDTGDEYDDGHYISLAPDNEDAVHPHDLDDETAVSEYDREKMLAGLEVLFNYFERLDKIQMPRIILFPDISARPLYYLVAPLLKFVYTQKGLNTPPTVFIKTPDRSWERILAMDIQPPRTLTEREKAELLDFSDLEASNMPEELKESLRILRRARAEQPPITKEQQDDYWRQQIEKGKEALRLRAKEILEKYLRHARGGEHILVIDDGATGRRNSIQLLRQSFVAGNPNIVVDAFVFLAPTEGHDASHDALVGAIDRTKELGRQSKGFDYREAYRPFGPSLVKELTGVNKTGAVESKYVAINDKRQIKTERDFRIQFGALGRTFINQKMTEPKHF